MYIQYTFRRSACGISAPIANAASKNKLPNLLSLIDLINYRINVFILSIQSFIHF